MGCSADMDGNGLSLVLIGLSGMEKQMMCHGEVLDSVFKETLYVSSLHTDANTTTYIAIRVSREVGY